MGCVREEILHSYKVAIAHLVERRAGNQKVADSRFDFLTGKVLLCPWYDWGQAVCQL